MTINDLINSQDQTMLFEIPWGIPLVRYINRFAVHRLLPITARASDIRGFLAELPNDMFFEVLSREVLKDDEYTGEIWVKVHNRHGVYVRPKTSNRFNLSNAMVNRTIVLGMVLLFLFVTKVSFDYAVTGEINVELLAKVIDLIISLLD